MWGTASPGTGAGPWGQSEGEVLYPSFGLRPVEVAISGPAKLNQMAERFAF